MVNAAVGALSHQLQDQYPQMARMAQLPPSQIHPRLGHKTATKGIFESEVRLSLRERARNQFLRVVSSYQKKYGAAPWGVYCDEIRVDPAPSFNPFELFWLSRTNRTYRGVSSEQLLARSDALAACIAQIQLGFHDASRRLQETEGILVAPIAGLTPGPKQRDPRTLQSYEEAAAAFAARHPDLNISWIVIWDYWGQGADHDAAGFARRSAAWWRANRAAYGSPVIRVARPVKMGNKGQVVASANGRAEAWSEEQLDAWWDATPSPPDGDPKGIWGVSDGANRANFQATAPRVAAHMIRRASE
ncbi:MAG: hypothetical protein ACIARR_07240 [Phycisphaerales bacterium JB059]